MSQPNLLNPWRILFQIPQCRRPSSHSTFLDRLELKLSKAYSVAHHICRLYRRLAAMVASIKSPQGPRKNSVRKTRAKIMLNGVCS